MHDQPDQPDKGMLASRVCGSEADERKIKRWIKDNGQDELEIRPVPDGGMTFPPQIER